MSQEIYIYIYIFGTKSNLQNFRNKTWSVNVATGAGGCRARKQMFQHSHWPGHPR